MMLLWQFRVACISKCPADWRSIELASIDSQRFRCPLVFALFAAESHPSVRTSTGCFDQKPLSRALLTIVYPFEAKCSAILVVVCPMLSVNSHERATVVFELPTSW